MLDCAKRLVQPDIIYISKERSRVIRKENIWGAPDLATEILSPGTIRRDQILKKTLYARYRVKEYWIVAPDKQTIAVLTLGKRGYVRSGLYTRDQLLHSPLLPSLKIEINQVFE